MGTIKSGWLEKQNGKYQYPETQANKLCNIWPSKCWFSCYGTGLDHNIILVPVIKLWLSID